jgi:AraC family transcriptional regulator
VRVGLHPWRYESRVMSCSIDPVCLSPTPPSVRADGSIPFAERRPTDELLAELRSLLNDEAASATLLLAARRLGTSPRTLQRVLRTLGTSFRAELAHVRIERARHRLLHDDVALTAIAFDLGYASLQSFDRQFRRLMGETPSGFRRRSRTAIR